MPRTENTRYRREVDAQKKGNASEIALLGLSKPAVRALTAAGYVTLEKLSKVTEADLLRLHGVGPKAIPVIRKALAAKGLSFIK